MKSWRDYHPNFQRVTLQAHSHTYRATFTSAEWANAFVRAAQKFASSVRADPDAPAELKAATTREAGGVLWQLPVQENGSWIVVGVPRPKRRTTVDEIAESLP